MRAIVIPTLQVSKWNGTFDYYTPHYPNLFDLKDLKNEEKGWSKFTKGIESFISKNGITELLLRFSPDSANALYESIDALGVPQGFGGYDVPVSRLYDELCSTAFTQFQESKFNTSQLPEIRGKQVQVLEMYYNIVDFEPKFRNVNKHWLWMNTLEYFTRHIHKRELMLLKFIEARWEEIQKEYVRARDKANNTMSAAGKELFDANQAIQGPVKAITLARALYHAGLIYEISPEGFTPMTLAEHYIKYFLPIVGKDRSIKAEKLAHIITKVKTGETKPLVATDVAEIIETLRKLPRPIP